MFVYRLQLMMPSGKPKDSFLGEYLDEAVKKSQYLREELENQILAVAEVRGIGYDVHDDAGFFVIAAETADKAKLKEETFIGDLEKILGMKVYYLQSQIKESNPK